MTVIPQTSPRKEAEVPIVSTWIRPGITSVAIAITAIVANAYGQQSLHITLRDGSKQTELNTRQSTVKELLDDQHIQLSKMDSIAPSLTSKLTSGMTKFRSGCGGFISLRDTTTGMKCVIPASKLILIATTTSRYVF